MRIFKRVAELEKQNIAMSTAVSRLQKELHILQERLPEYEEAIAKGVGKEWDKAVQSVIDFNPYARRNSGDG